MIKAICAYVRFVDGLNRFVGRGTMYLIFVMMGILFYSSVSKTFFTPALWTLEMAQFTMTAYYLLGGAYSMQMGSHVRMDLLYGSWTPRRQAWTDAFTVFFLLFYLGVLLYGGFSSTEYALRYGERSFSSWAPPMAPIKIIMTVAIFLMLLQAVSTLFKNIAQARGKILS
ncbi:MAG: TRAP transporter small permease subunit [Hyphomicrobiales bacterium]|nr:TRAP transporter small permease subunit [Hyphomicrobiales bacterium]